MVEYSTRLHVEKKKECYGIVNELLSMFILLYNNLYIQDKIQSWMDKNT